MLSLCIHSYGQLWMWPYGYTKHEAPSNIEEIKRLGVKASDTAKKVHGTVFTPQNSSTLCNIFKDTKILFFLISDQSAGTSRDWYKDILGSRFVYTLELREAFKNKKYGIFHMLVDPPPI